MDMSRAGAAQSGAPGPTKDPATQSKSSAERRNTGGGAPGQTATRQNATRQTISTDNEATAGCRGGRRERSRRSRFMVDPNGRTHRGVYSAIDLGTNNCRLLIAKPTPGGFRVVDAFSRIVRLGEGIAAEGIICDAAMDRAIEALKVCADKIDRRGVTCMRHVATEACRIAANRDEFVARIRDEAGLNIEVISAAEEARLAVMGCQSLVSSSNQHALVFDIGGGSTELIWIRMRRGRRCEIHGWMSMPYGVVNLTERFAEDSAHAPDMAYSQMVAEVRSHLAAFEAAHGISETVKNQRVQFLGTSGTVTTLASLHLKLPRYMRDRVDGAWMRAADIESLSHQVAMMSFEERAAQPCIGRERADLVVAGCAILEAILSTWPVPSLRVADRGIREGILRGLMELDPPPVLAFQRPEPQAMPGQKTGDSTAPGAARKRRSRRGERRRGRARQNPATAAQTDG